jgi:23S rRNA (uracil1939-C5)-methyltransferase
MGKHAVRVESQSDSRGKSPTGHNGGMTKPSPETPRATFTVTCGPLVAGGDALVRREGQKTLFVTGGIPGEQVEVEVYDDRKDLARARVTKVLDPSPFRTTDPNPDHESEWGGLQWRHIASEQQGAFKTDIVRDALTRIAKRPEAQLTFTGSVSPFGYRTTMRMPIVNGRAGGHVSKSSETVALDAAPIADPLLEELIIDGRFGDATEVRLRVGTSSKERLAWITGGKKDPVLPEDVQVTRNGRKAFVHEDVLGSTFQVSARAFFQSGPEAAELLASTVSKHVPHETQLILDAYSGIGMLGGVLAKERKARLIAIEQDGASVNDSKVNLQEIDTRLILGEVAAVRPGDVELPQVIVADPARSGLGPSASRALAQLQAERIVLVSCDPASLARDVNLLANNGYDLQTVEVLDLFPQTPHVETVSVFIKQ